MAYPSVRGILYRRAREEAADFAMAHIEKAMLFGGTEEIRRYAIGQIAQTTGLFLEFGVHWGESINFFADILAKRDSSAIIHGFDSFEGLRDSWYGTHMPPRHFSHGGKMPPVRKNVVLHKGWVQDTLADFLAKQPGPISFVHMDLDTYESTKFALELLKERISKDCIVLFDEFYGYPNWRQGEYRAVVEVFGENAFEYIAFSDEKVAVRVR